MTFAQLELAMLAGAVPRSMHANVRNMLAVPPFHNFTQHPIDIAFTVEELLRDLPGK